MHVCGLHKPVYNLSLNHTKWVRAYLTESQLGKVKPGFSATVHNDSFPDTDFKGTVGFISSVAEFTPKNVETPDLRTALVYEVRIIVDDPDNRLRLGAPATVTIPLDDKAFRYFNVKTNAWEVEGGEYRVQVGASVQDIRLTASLTVEGTGAPLP